jgi:hypothetical protein
MASRSEEELRLIGVVRPAAQLDVVDRGLSADGVRRPVVELEEPARVTTVAVRRHERAAASVAEPHRALDRGGDGARVRVLFARLARPRRRRELLTGQFLEEHGERAVKDLGRIAVRDHVPQQILGLE